MLRQVHGDRVVTVASPGDKAGERADAAVTACQGAALTVLTADCAPVAFASPEGIAGVAHAGWRGLTAGVIGSTVEAMRALGASRVEAVVGPCIGPECYAFGPDDLDTVASRLGPAVRAVDRTGRPALDLAAGVAVALEQAGAHVVAVTRTCTGCSAEHWSWRARRDTARQGMVVWRP